MAKTVLVVDDDIDFRLQMRMHLEQEGFQVVEAANLDEADAWLAEHKPDLALVDLMMNHTDDGFTLCHHIKRKDNAIPVIMITGVTGDSGINFEPTSREDRSWIQADVVLNKPVRFEQLRKEMDRLMVDA